MAKLEEIVEKLRKDERYAKSAELLESMKDVDDEKLPYLDKLIDIFKSTPEDIKVVGKDNNIVTIEGFVNGDKRLQEWIQQMEFLFCGLNNYTKEILEYELEFLNQQKNLPSGPSSPSLISRLIITKAIDGVTTFYSNCDEFYRFYTKLMKKIIDQGEKLVTVKEPPNPKKFPSGIPLAYHSEICRQYNSRDDIIKNGLSLLDEMGVDGALGETEFNLISPIFDNLDKGIKNKGYLLHLIEKSISLGLIEYTKSVMDSKANTLTKCFLLTQPIPESLTEISKQSGRFSEFVDSFEKYVKFIESITPHLYDPKKLQIDYKCSGVPMSEDDNGLARVTPSSKYGNPLSELFFNKKLYGFLMRTCEILSTPIEDEPDYHKLIKMLMQDRIYPKNSKKYTLTTTEYDVFRFIYSLGKNFKSKYPLEDILKLIVDIYLYDEPSHEYLSDKGKENAFELIKKGTCESIEEIKECATIDIPDYKIIKKLGEGVSGSTFLVYSKELDENRALKVISKSKVNPKEAKLMARLKGGDLENIVQIYDAGNSTTKVSGERVYSILMEYVNGKNISELIKENKISLEKGLDYSAQIFNGILSLRAHRITHRDLNPVNIKVNSKGIVKILDFGIATTEENPKQKDARKYGTPSGINASDIFSLGLITYKMATGEHLILSRGEEMTTQRYANKIAELKEELYDNGKLKEAYRENIEKKVPEEIRQIIFACLERNDEIDFIKQTYKKAREELKYYFMDKSDLINRIKELEDGN